jgi:hypothetical protein
LARDRFSTNLGRKITTQGQNDRLTFLLDDFHLQDARNSYQADKNAQEDERGDMPALKARKALK